MSWYEIKAVAQGRIAEIFIFDVIVDYAWDEDEVTAKGFIDELKALGELDEIRVRIHSPGGSVWAGNVIYNVLKRHSAKVTVIVDGLAASIASVIAMAGDTIIMPENAMMMIHNPMAYGGGNVKELQKVIDRLETAKVGMLASYSSKTGLTDEKLIDLLDAETWMTAADAKLLGFADEVGQPVEMAAKFDLSRYSNAPQSLFNNLQPAVPKPPVPVAQQTPEQGDEMMDLKALKEKHPDLYAQVLKEGEDNGIKAGITAEVERVKAVNAALIPGHEELIATLAADGKTTGAEAALAVNQAENKLRQTTHEQIIADSPAAPNAAEPGDDDAEARETKENVSGLVAGMNRG